MQYLQVLPDSTGYTFEKSVPISYPLHFVQMHLSVGLHMCAIRNGLAQDVFLLMRAEIYEHSKLLLQDASNSVQHWFTGTNKMSAEKSCKPLGQLTVLEAEWSSYMK